MPFKDRFAFIEEQINKGCQCNHIALMSGAFNKEHFAKANSLGLKIFKKPFPHSEIKNWIDQVEENIAPKRRLADWFLKRIAQDKEE